MRYKYSLMILVVVVVLGVSGYLRWKEGVLYQGRFYSPNYAYYVQKYTNPTFRRLTGAMPGQSSDMVDGYIRLFAADGTLLQERFETFIRDIEPVWADSAVYLRGVEEMDNAPWLLPTSSEE